MPLALWFVIVFMAISSLTRLALMFLHFGELSSAAAYIPLSLVAGMVFDLYVGLWITLPLVLLMLVLPVRWRDSRWVRWPISASAWLYTFGLLYLGVTEIFFFDEFNSRLNYIAVDYLIYPHEVFVNIWETYPVATALAATMALALVGTWFTRRIRRSGLAKPSSVKARAGMILAYFALIVLGLVGLNIDSSRISDNRMLNEITGNGIYSFAHAARTNELDYNQYYAQIDDNLAARRLRMLLEDSHSKFLYTDSLRSIDRRVEGDRPTRPFNIVLVLEESFGSNFVGGLHPEGKRLTPEFDRLSAEHGTLFTHVYATGNRTVRGIEATLASFPPIPGRSIVKRPGNEDVFAVSSLLKIMGYSTVFVYGGLAYFDNIGAFASNNGYDRVIDEMDFDDPVFKTVWGVSDEDLFNKSLTTCDSLYALSKPFFATLLTVSNHSPFTYPAGRIPFDPEERKRDNAVRYADFAIGKFIADARSHPFYDSTLFVVLADHGARVYGVEQIPIRSYEIPVLFYNPVLNPTGTTCDVLGSQMDIAPTILDFLGIDYNSAFFGRSLLSTPEEDRRVLISHNRDVSLMRDGIVAVLGIQGNCGMWRVDSAAGKFVSVETPPDSALIDDAIAYYMTAFDMYRDHLLHPLDQHQFVR
jgi:phosphoglycerol transferase MdoB-like AlkP superfamily enzyme